MNDSFHSDQGKLEVLRMAAEIVSAYVSNNQLPGAQIPDVIRSVYNCLSGLDVVAPPTIDPGLKPAVAVKKSITPDYLVCLEDGKKLKMLKRYLRTTYGMTPEQYRSKWGLPSDYPMVAPNYAKQRSTFAKTIGLGRKGRGGRVGKAG